MNIDFEQVLFWGTAVTGFVVLLDILFFAAKRKKRPSKDLPGITIPPSQPNKIIEYSRSFFPILFIVLFIRSFLYEPFRIPSGSLEPTLHMGDFILANKYSFGIRLPVWRKKIIEVGEPKRGDIIVFRWPPDTHYYFIKRIVGIPGDKVEYINKVLYVNGQEASQTSDPTLPIEKSVQRENGEYMQVVEKQENLLGVVHKIYQEPSKMGYNFQNVTIPEGMYMVMGDNRDDSADSRYWGFVPEENIVGKAVLIWLSWDTFAPYDLTKIRWNRIGKRIE